MTKRAFTFPGQGSQAVGMGKDLADAYQEARNVFAEVDDALGQKLSTIMFEGPDETLRLTENAQPALMAVSVAVTRVLESRGVLLKDHAAYVAGHSLGEYSALAAAGAFSLADAARLRSALDAGRFDAVSAARAERALCDAEDFVDLARAAAWEGSPDDVAPRRLAVRAS